MIREKRFSPLKTEKKTFTLEINSFPADCKNVSLDFSFPGTPNTRETIITLTRIFFRIISFALYFFGFPNSLKNYYFDPNIF